MAKSPLDIVSVGTKAWGTAFLLALAPCAFILLIAFFPIVEDWQFIRFSLILTGIIALFPLVLLGDMLCVAFSVHWFGVLCSSLVGRLHAAVWDYRFASHRYPACSHCPPSPFRMCECTIQRIAESPHIGLQALQSSFQN